jgi:two-component system response regulator HydG
MTASTEPLQLIGTSRAIHAIREEIVFAARTDAKVLLTGESGAGKEIVARLIHAASSRRHAPLVTINCAAMTETLLETELFGHVRGSFTDALRDRTGVFEQAHQGTVFMDEVGETSARMQGLLLRFLETGEIQRVGSDRPDSRVDVRVIAATNRNLLAGVHEKTFREDLYYRLNVVHVQVPPLRERREDIAPLMAEFLRSFAEKYGLPMPVLHPSALERLVAYHWPGNVRELKNLAESLVVRNHSRQLDAGDFPFELINSHVVAPLEASVSAEARVAILFDLMTVERKSFWSVVYAPFVARDLTRADLRAIVRKGLERTGGDYQAVTELFNMPPGDCKRFLNFLRKHHCRVPAQLTRPAESGGPDETAPQPVVARARSTAFAVS